MYIKKYNFSFSEEKTLTRGKYWGFILAEVFI